MIRYKPPKNTLVQIFIKIIQLDQKLLEGANYQHFNIIIHIRPSKTPRYEIWED